MEKINLSPDRDQSDSVGGVNEQEKNKKSLLEELQDLQQEPRAEITYGDEYRDELSAEERESLIVADLKIAALLGKTRCDFNLKPRHDYVNKEEGQPIGPEEKEVVVGNGNKIILRNYGKQLYDFLESRGLEVVFNATFVDNEDDKPQDDYQRFPRFMTAWWERKERKTE